jgi:hypothetical protein
MKWRTDLLGISQGFLEKDDDEDGTGEEDGKGPGQVGRLLSPLIQIMDRVRKTSTKQNIIIGTQVRV